MCLYLGQAREDFDRGESDVHVDLPRCHQTVTDEGGGVAEHFVRRVCVGKRDGVTTLSNTC